MTKYLAAASAVTALALVAAVAALAGNGTPLNTGSANTLTLAVFGDAPYGLDNSDTREFAAMPAFIDGINSDPQVDLVAHVGDIHSGKQYCTEGYDQSVYDLWTAFKDPLVYTPGDNEWTDCNKAGEGGGTYNKTTKQIDYVLDPATGAPADYAGGDPVENLGLVRSIFFANPGYTLGGRNKQVVSQAQVGAGTDRNYVENVMWEQSRTVFVTVNLPGGSNDDADPWYKAPITQRQLDERAQRDAADLHWIDAAFSQAQQDGAGAVVILAQADMWDLDGTPNGPNNHIANYRPFIDEIAADTLAFGKPVLLFNGDSHQYRSDNPLVDNAPCVEETQPASGGPAVPCGDDAYDNQALNGRAWNVPNFHRVVVHGDNQATDAPLEWTKLTDDPRAANATTSTSTSFGPFTWSRQIGPTP